MAGWNGSSTFTGRHQIYMSYRRLIDGESLAERQLGSGMRRLGRAYDMVGLRGGSSPSLMRR